MKKALLFLVLSLLILSAVCAAFAQQDPMAIPTEAPSAGSDLPEGYDPASEEDHGYSYTGGVYDDYGRAKYAGASPIPLDPIDMPTPTPKPTLTFNYGLVTSDKVGISFEAPMGWMVDLSSDDTVTLMDPNTLDGYQSTLTVRIVGVASTYSLSELKSDLLLTLKELGQFNYATWSTTETASRTLLKKDGYYADYRGTTYDGVAVHGRVMMALLDGNKVITVHISCPDGFFSSSYKGVINHVRETLKLL